VTGLDLVKLQIEIAAGARLPFTQDEVGWRGSAIECRIYAEDPANNFLPFPGKITRLAEPSGPGVRLDSGVYEGWTVPMDYDPLLAKLAVWAPTREHAAARAVRALSEYHVGGIRANIGFFREILEDPEFRAARLHTGFIEEFLQRTEFLQRARPPAPPENVYAVAALVAALHASAQSGSEQERPAATSAWLTTGRSELLR
jgi:acetyl-CoA carboxylase biotin carboxylase subunit